MKNILFILLVALNFIGLSKEKSIFIGLKVSNGRTMFIDRYTYINQTTTDKRKLFYTGVYLNYGGTIKNLSIYSGIGYNFYQEKPNMYTIEGEFPIRVKRNYNIITIPINVDYNVNLYKQKLFFVVGVGGELGITFKEKIKFPNNEYMPGINLKEYKKASFAITARTGLLYNINKRFDFFAYFDFSHHVTRYLQVKGYTYPKKDGNHPYNIAGSIGFNVKFYKKTPTTEKTK